MDLPAVFSPARPEGAAMSDENLFHLLCEAREYVQECADIGYDRSAAERLLARMTAAGVPVPPPWVAPPEKPCPPTPPPKPPVVEPPRADVEWGDLWIAA